MFDVPHWSKVSTPFHHIKTGAKDLLITAGDSWTYGDSLGKTKIRFGIDDTDYRLNHIYGRLISDELRKDWINLALPGISNTLILHWIGNLLNVIDDYRDILCSINLTESGRHEDMLLTRPKDTMQDTLIKILEKTYARISKLKKRHTNVSFLVTHNFTDPLSNTGIKTWLEVLSSTVTRNQTHILLSEHISQLNNGNDYKDRDIIINKALERLDILDACRYCNSGDSRHPNEIGHELWASYLLKILT